MHDPNTILLSSLRLIITKIRAKYLSKRVYGFREKVERTDRYNNFEKYYNDDDSGSRTLFEPPWFLNLWEMNLQRLFNQILLSPGPLAC